VGDDLERHDGKRGCRTRVADWMRDSPRGEISRYGTWDDRVEITYGRMPEAMASASCSHAADPRSQWSNETLTSQLQDVGLQSHLRIQGKLKDIIREATATRVDVILSSWRSWSPASGLPQALFQAAKLWSQMQEAVLHGLRPLHRRLPQHAAAMWS
jgi:hypothetical protein